MPVYKTLDTKSAMSFYTFITNMFKNGFNPSILLLDQTNIVIARNELASMTCDFIRKGASYSAIVWMDSDHVFSFDQFLKLLDDYDRNKEQVDVLSARYITRDIHKPKVCAFTNMGGIPDRKYLPVPPETTGVIEVDAFGFGFCIMKPEVLLRMTDVYGKSQFQFYMFGDPKDGKMVSEDMYWCEKAKELGITLYLDNDVEVGHYGGIIDSSVFTVNA